MEKEKLSKIEIRFKILSYLFVVFVIVTSSLFIVMFKERGNLDIVRAKGLIIEDEKGRDRILIGAPIPFSKDRVRLDSAKVRKWWASEFEGQEKEYMEWYKNYKHSAVGMVVMNDKGFDRVLIGDSLADPNIGNRSFELSGMIWNDAQGWERGGLGVNTTKSGLSRSVIGVDAMSGEAAHLVAMEDGTKGLIINQGEGRIIIGQSKKKNSTEADKELMIRYFNNKGDIVWERDLSRLVSSK